MKYTTLVSGMLLSLFSACSEPEVPLPRTFPKCEAKLENVRLYSGMVIAEANGFRLRLGNSQTDLQVDREVPSESSFEANDTTMNNHDPDGSIDYFFIVNRESPRTYISRDELGKGECGWLLEGEADLGDYSCEDVKAFTQEVQKVFDCYVPKLRKEKFRLTELEKPIDYSLTLDQVLDAKDSYSVPEEGPVPSGLQGYGVDCIEVGGMLFDCKQRQKPEPDCTLAGGRVFCR